LSDLITGEKKRRQTQENAMGAVPIGIPLIAGPALLTTCILLADEYGKWITGLAMVTNILLAGFVFFFADQLTLWIGRNGTRTASKISSLFLAAIGVMLIRKGILEAVAAVLEG
jgi:multiple antibiotic resistance protein